VSHASHDLLFAGILVNGVLTRALVDTGATHSLVSSAWAERLELITVASPVSTVTAADGHSLPLSGSAHVRIDMGALRFGAPLVVLPSLAFDMVLGLDILARIAGSVHVGSRTLCSPSLPEPVPLFSSADEIAFASAAVFSFDLPSSSEDPDLLPLSFSEASLSWAPANWAKLRDLAVQSLPDTTTAADKARFGELLDKHKSACAIDPKAPGLANVEPFRLRTTESYPIAHRARRFSPAERSAVNDEVRRLLAAGIIQPSKSPWAAPIVPIAKPDGSIRTCIDYRGLNRVTIADKYPMPNAQAIFDQLHGFSLFSTFDLAAGFWQVPTHSDDMHKTAFVCELGLFEFTGMPMGPKGAPAHFQRVMDVVLAPLPPLTALPFMDDVISPASDFDDFMTKLDVLLSALSSHGLRLRLDKCKFCQSSVKFLGHTVSSRGLGVDPEKTDAVARLARPSSVPEVRQFIGLAGYYRQFVRNFAEIAQPLTALTRKSARFVWSDDCESAFVELKRRLAAPPVLVFPDYARPFTLATDASKTAVGAILSQPYPDGERPVSFFSRQLRPAETRYFISELEALAVVQAIRHFRPYLHGRKFTVLTDHRALEFLLNPSTELSDRLQRWALKLQSYSFTVVYRKGSEMGHVDALSRLGRVNALATTALPDTLLAAQIADPVLGPTRELLLFGTQPPDTVSSQVLQLASHPGIALDSDRLRLVFRKDPNEPARFCVPSSLRAALLTAAHDAPTSGHLGSARTLERLAAFYWSSMRSDVANWCRSCTTCSARSSPRTAPPGLLMPLAPTYPGEVVVMDFLGPLPLSSRGNKFILVFADHFSKWVETVAVPSADAVTVADALVERIVCRLGPPATLLSDKGTHFTAQLIKTICSRLGSDQRHSTAYHPQTQGIVERFNATLLDLLAKHCSSDQTDWDAALPLLAWAYNSSVHPATGLSPFEVIHGTVPRSVFDLALEVPMQPGTASASVVEYVERLRERLISTRSLVLNMLDQARDRYRRAYDSRHRDIVFSVGDEVMLHTPVPRKGISPKLQNLWTGPWTVIEVVNRLNYVIELNKKRQLVSITRLKAVIPRKDHGTDFVPPSPAPSPATDPAAPGFVLLPHADDAADNAPPPIAPAPLLPLPPPNPPDPPVDNNDLENDQDQLPFVPPGMPPPPPGEYYIEQLIDRKRSTNNRGFVYKVRWTGYDDTHDEWIAASNLPKHFVTEYDQAHPRQAANPPPAEQAEPEAEPGPEAEHEIEHEPDHEPEPDQPQPQPDQPQPQPQPDQPQPKPEHRYPQRRRG